MTNYYVTDGKQYISTKTNIHTVSDIKSATQMNLMKASNILKTLPKTLDQIADWTILPVPDSEIQTNEDDTLQVKIEFVDVNSIIESLKQMSEKAEYLNKYSKSINKQLSEIELEIEDMYHYIEFSSFNAAQGYHAYKMLKERLIKRRQLKDEQILLDSIQERNMLTCTKDHVDNTVSKLDERKYRPRVLKELFNV
jgi:hypothetical protein